MAGWHGTAMLCYDPEGAPGLPNAEDVREGLIATRSRPMRLISLAIAPARTVTTSSAAPATTSTGTNSLNCP